MRTILLSLVAALAASPLPAPALAQTTTDEPFTRPIVADREVVEVDVVEFAEVPDADGAPARMMLLVEEPGTERLFVNDMRGPLYALGPDGGGMTEYVDIDDPSWGVEVEASGRERGFQSFAFHPGFADPGSPGHGRFYTWTDSRNTDPEPDFRPDGGQQSHHTVLLEWRAEDPAAATYDGGPPRELLRLEQPYGNHNAGHLAFRPGAEPGDPDYGLLYVGSADGGSGGDPLDLAQDPGSAFGKILRIDPVAPGSDGRAYGIPPANPFVADEDALDEIYVYGLRNPQRFGWDPATGVMFVADIGQSIVEELSPATAGTNLGWNAWEGSFRFLSRSEVSLEDPRSDPAVTYPVAEYDHRDPLLLGRAAVTGVQVYRDGPIRQLRDRILFGDMPSGEIFHVDADDLPDGGQDPIRRVVLRKDGEPKTLLQLVREKNEAQGRSPAGRTDLRFGTDADGRVFLLNKHDGTIRLLVPDGGS